MTWTLHNADCLGPGGLESLADRSVAHFIFDPPFSERVHARLGKEDRNDGTSARDALTFAHITNDEAETIADQAARIVTRWILIFCDEVSLVMWKGALESAGCEYVRKGTWVKNAPMPQMSGDRPAVGTEEIVIAHAPRTKGRMRWNGGGKPATYFANPQEPGVPRVHPAQKPLKLMRALVEDFSDAGELIIDPYAGSCSTLIACEQLGRNAIGWEKEAAMYETGLRRLRGDECKPAPGQLQMFGAK